MLCTIDPTIVEGIQYHSQEHDRGRITKNHSVIVPSSYNGKNMIFFYSLLKVVELSYMFGIIYIYLIASSMNVL